ncbi:MAG: 50S ribosomal protein L11 methyltransferase [Desulfococcaceae bacterium]
MSISRPAEVSRSETHSSRQWILDLLARSESSLTPAQLTDRIRRKTNLERREARALIRSLVAENLLTYADRHGRTVVEISLRRPVALSDRVVIAPPGISVPEKSGRVVVRLQGGPAFGDGGHPTTRLSVQAIDGFLARPANMSNPPLERALDIGCGSGILALTALALGVRRAVGLDIDPLARAETVANARLNEMANRLTVSGDALETLSPPFHLIIANLRPPTLRKMLPEIKRLAATEAGLVLSGFRSEEAEDLFRTVESAGIKLVHHSQERGWAAGAFALPKSM